jgi:hypothetical protein
MRETLCIITAAMAVALRVAHNLERRLGNDLIPLPCNPFPTTHCTRHALTGGE